MNELTKIPVKEHPETNTVELSTDTFDWIVKSRNSILDTLRTLHDAFEQDNYHFAATLIEAIQHNDWESVLEIHDLMQRFYEKYDDILIDEREQIRKRWK